VDSLEFDFDLGIIEVFSFLASLSWKSWMLLERSIQLNARLAVTGLDPWKFDQSG
jgi:hypothetical protein